MMKFLNQITENDLASYILYDLNQKQFSHDVMKLSHYLKEYYAEEVFDETLLDILNGIEIMDFETFNEHEEMNFRSEHELLNAPYYKNLIKEDKLYYQNGIFIIDKVRNKYWF